MKFISNAKYWEPAESGSIFDGKIGNLCVSIHKIYGGENWYLSCYDLNISKKPLQSKGIIEAINESKEVLKRVVDNLQEDVNSFFEENIEFSRY